MKRFFVVSLVFAAGVGVGLSGRGAYLKEAAAVVPPRAAENGDANGDGQRDISDAVYLINWLFVSGPEPVPFEAPSRFVDHRDKTVTDRASGRMWQKATSDIDGDASISHEADAVTIDEAWAFVESLRFANHDDWRLPTQMELSSLVEVGQDIWGPVGGPTIDPIFESQTGSYWVSSTNAGDPCHGGQFVVSFSSGAIRMVGTPDARAFVRAVRSP